jgi:hypothetical protein
MTSEPTILTERHAAATPSSYAEDGLFTALIDLLADAMHWCDESGDEFHYALCVAGKHYLAELNDEQTDERRMTP